MGVTVLRDDGELRALCVAGVARSCRCVPCHVQVS